MKVYSVHNDPKHLLLVDGLHVINGNYDLQQTKDGLRIPMRDVPVQYVCDVQPVMKGVHVDYNATLEKIEN